MDRIVTIEDIATAAGVGKGTVDRVLHNRGRVAPATREKVLKCIEELNYRPNKVARMLARKRAYRIAVCYHEKEIDFWNQVRDGIRRADEEYAQMGVKIVHFVFPQIDPDAQLRVIRQIIAEKYDGLAIVPYFSQEIKDALNEMIAAGTPVVTFNNRERGVNACYVGTDGIQSGRTAGKMMSLIAPPESNYLIVATHDSRMMQIDERAMGFQEIICQRRRDMRFKGLYIFDEDYDKVYEFVIDTLRNKPEVNALYATSECLSVVGKAVHDLKLDRKIAVVGHDLTPPIIDLIRCGCIDAAIGQEPERQGYASIDKICRKLLTGEEMHDEYTNISIAVAENLDRT